MHLSTLLIVRPSSALDAFSHGQIAVGTLWWSIRRLQEVIGVGRQGKRPAHAPRTKKWIGPAARNVDPGKGHLPTQEGLQLVQARGGVVR